MKDLSADPLESSSAAAATYARLDSTPSRGELYVTAHFGQQGTALNDKTGAALSASSSNGTDHMTILVAPFPLIVSGCWVSWYGGTITANNTNYWTFDVSKIGTAGANYGSVVRGTSQLTGDSSWGVNLTPNRAWSLNSFEWDANKATMAPGDTVSLTVTSTGTPTGVPQGMLTVTLQYNPL